MAGAEGDKPEDSPDSPSAGSATTKEDEPVLPALLGPALSSEQQLEVRDRYLDWASLLKRDFGEDILACPRCGHRSTRVIAAIDDPPLVKKILGHLGLPTERPAISVSLRFSIAIAGTRIDSFVPSTTTER